MTNVHEYLLLALPVDLHRMDMILIWFVWVVWVGRRQWPFLTKNVRHCMCRWHCQWKGGNSCSRACDLIFGQC